VTCFHRRSAICPALEPSLQRAESALDARLHYTVERGAVAASHAPRCCKHRSSSHPADGRAVGIGQNRPRRARRGEPSGARNSPKARRTRRRAGPRKCLGSAQPGRHGSVRFVGCHRHFRHRAIAQASRRPTAPRTWRALSGKHSSAASRGCRRSRFRMRTPPIRLRKACAGVSGRWVDDRPVWLVADRQTWPTLRRYRQQGPRQAASVRRVFILSSSAWDRRPRSWPGCRARSTTCRPAPCTGQGRP
jgi:hypothetical protein